MKRLMLIVIACACATARAATTPAAPGAGATPPAGGTPAAGGHGAAPAQHSPAAPQPGGRGQKSEAPAEPTIKIAFEAPPVKPYTEFPSVELKTPNLATYIGLQFGPGKQDVAYVCFDTESKEKIHDRAFVFVPSTNAPKATPIRGHNDDVKAGGAMKGGKTTKEKPQRFELPLLHSKIGDNELTSKVTLTYGIDKSANLNLDAEIFIKEPKGKMSFGVHGSLADVCVPMPNEIKVLPLLGAPTMQIYEDLKVNPPMVRPYLTIGEKDKARFILDPQSGMDDFFTIQVTQHGEAGNDKVIEKTKMPIKIPLHSSPGQNGAGDSQPIKGLKGGNNYTVEASIHFGPFGTFSEKTDIKMPGKVKK